ncbi:hypothetical protein C8F04DRAFT_1170693 [Mycena alexandri]|uniref:Uncharacterized protein n=1 Tax=Mycena alexandri TaxID=1745969 RepID=A0AAD6RX43_9AGAR|nr:hypothetical protein C8F04DRAFT_1170693 [Mycena alexandri]
MGSAISAVREQAQAGDESAKKKMKEQLDFLVKAVDAKLDGYQGELDAGFSDPSSIQKRQVPGIRAMRWSREYRVDVSKNANDQIGAAVDSFFGAAEEGADVRKSVISGFKSVVKAGLDVFLGNGEAGEQEDQKFFVFMQHNALVRIDIKMWRYNFSGKGVMSEHENVFGSVMCLSVVDHMALKLDEMVFLLSEYAGDDTTAVELYVDKLVSLWRKVMYIPTNEDRNREPPRVFGGMAALAAPTPAGAA